MVARSLANLGQGGQPGNKNAAKEENKDANLHLGISGAQLCANCLHHIYDKGDKCSLHHQELPWDAIACVSFAFDPDCEDSHTRAAPVTRQQAADMLQVSVSLLQGEYAENELRKGFTVSERVEIGRALEEELRNRHGGDRKSADIQEGNFSTLIPEGKTRDIAAEKAGFGNGKTYEQAKKAFRVTLLVIRCLRA